jgi:hypothetical protein
MIDAATIHGLIVQSGRRQIATAAVAKAILNSGAKSSDLEDLLCQIAGNAANAICNSVHEAASGALCHEGPDGFCTACCVEMTVCDVCNGIGYHREGCTLIGGDAL